MNNMMDILAQRAARANPEAPGDYLGEDGRLYCGKCHTPKQWRSPEGHLFPCTCKCAGEIRKQEEAEQRRKDRFDRACDSPAFSALHDRKIGGKTFDRHDGTNAQALKAALTYVKHWAEAKERGGGLLFWGDTGTGKSFLSCCIANALMAQMVPVLVTSTSRFLSELSGPGVDKNALFDGLNAFDLLVLDDFGAERQSSYALEQTTRLVDERTKANLPLIISTNVPLSEFKAPENMELHRIYDRVIGFCVPIKLDGESHRAQAGKERMAWMRGLLGV